MSLLTEAQRQRLLQNGADPDRDHAPVVRLYMPDIKAQWLFSALDPDDPDLAFGLGNLGMEDSELGWSSIREFDFVKAAFGVDVINDADFEPHYPISVYARAARIAGAITLDARLLALCVDEPDKPPGHPKPPQP